ncbi:TRAP transporter large permease subunit [Chloroflexota bacterium]
MNIGLLTVILFSIVILFLILGVPVAFSLGAAAVIMALWLVGPASLFIMFTTAEAAWTNYVLLAIPLFVIMANFLAKSGVADALYEMMYHWIGALRGGLAIGTVGVCAIFAAMSGVSAAGTLTMGLIALPSMLRRGYDKNIAVGTISAAGSLGILIPPSITMIIFASLSGESVARLFAGGLFPGIMLAGIFATYIAIRTHLRPHLAPPIPKEERLPLGKRLALFKAVVAPIMLILLVLGVIYTGAATPTEAAGIGALGALILAIANRKFSWTLFRGASKDALFITVMTGWLVLGAKGFSHIYTTIGVPQYLSGLVATAGINKWAVVIMMQFILLILGCIIDPFGIMMITVPVFLPIVEGLGFNLVWFGILYVINMETALITPPFGINLFYMKGVVPPGISMADIYKSIIWFVLLELAGLATVMVFPEIVLWLPRTLFGT